MTALIPEHDGHPGWYKDCTEQACLDRHRRYMKRWRYERSHGRLRILDADAARRHIDALIGRGWSLRAISGTAGISPTSVHRLTTGAGRANRKTLDAILSVDPDQIPALPSRQTGEPFVPRVGTTRRIQALLFMGWTHAHISKVAGLKSASLLNQQGRWVTRSTHDKVAAAYDQLAMTSGPSEQTRGWARRYGYAGPLDWDDIDHDPAPASHHHTDVDRAFDEVAIERRMAGDKAVRISKSEVAELRRRWVSSGRPFNELERVTGLNPDRYKADIREAS